MVCCQKGSSPTETAVEQVNAGRVNFIRDILEVFSVE